MIIRNMEEKDLNDVAILYESLSGKKSNIENMANKFALINSNASYNVAVAEDSGKIVGTAMGIICHNMMADLNSFLVIEAFIVDEAHRRQGIGKNILLYLENKAKSCGCSYIILISGELRTDAHKLYTHLGYGKDNAKGFRKMLVS
ncbi:MAG: putative acetyltransferase, family [Firmicutes bacterium]|nr:putative acetyltransferase, family [Bacillota bacterium]